MADGDMAIAYWEPWLVVTGGMGFNRRNEQSRHRNIEQSMTSSNKPLYKRREEALR